MASIRDLRKDINYVLGDIIDAVYFTGKMQTEEGKALTAEIINIFDTLIDRVADRTVESRGAHLKQVRREFEGRAEAFIQRLNQLAQKMFKKHLHIYKKRCYLCTRR